MEPKEIHNKRILYACNDWGYGHLSRSIGIIRSLISQNNKLYFAGNFIQNEILKSYFPEIIFINLDGYQLKFKGSGNWNMELLGNTFQLFRAIKNEKKILNELCKNYHIQIVISDHRYGLFNKTTPSYFITHQLTLPVYGLQKIGNWWHHKQLKKFNAIWVLDDFNHSYSGSLSKSQSSKLKIKHIGIQSRFTPNNNTTKETYHYILAIISGPSPYSIQLLEEILSHTSKTTNKIICILPTELNIPTKHPENISFYSSNNWKELDELYYNCAGIISRSGYTTLMDIEILQKKACLIPTPGQPEQLYLSKLHTNKYPSNLSTLTNDYFFSTDLQ